MSPKPVHFGVLFRYFLVTFFGHRSLIGLRMHFRRPLAPFGLPLRPLGPFGSHLAPFWLPLAPFGLPLRPFCFHCGTPWLPVGSLLAVFGFLLIYFSSFLCCSLLSHYFLGLPSLVSALAAFKKKEAVSPRFASLQEKIKKKHIVPFSIISNSTDTRVLLLRKCCPSWVHISRETHINALFHFQS